MAESIISVYEQYGLPIGRPQIDTLCAMVQTCKSLQTRCVMIVREMEILFKLT